MLNAMSTAEGNSPKEKKPDVKAMTSKQYLDEFVVPHVLKALNVLNEKRPEDPIRFLGQYFTDYQAERVKDEPGSPEGSEENGNAMEEGTV